MACTYATIDKQSPAKNDYVKKNPFLVLKRVLNGCSNYKPRRIPSPTWHECIKKIWEVDPLECPKCHGEMKIISFITEKPVVRKILEHLELWKETKRGPPNKASPPAETITEIKEREYEPFKPVLNLIQ